MTSPTKPEVFYVLHCCQRRTEPWLRVTCTENLVKFGHVVFEICEWTDRQTNRHTDHNTSFSYHGKVIIDDVGKIDEESSSVFTLIGWLLF